MDKKAFSTLLALAISLPAMGQQSPPGSLGGVTGIVRYPDGNPSAGATVYARSECTIDHFHLVHQAKTSADGSFFIPPFLDVSCNLVQLSADKADDLWLKTGRNVFDEKDNGTSPLVEVPRLGSPIETEILLGKRGALLSLRVWDKATDRFIWASLHVERMPKTTAYLGTMELATGRDGSADTLLLPAGQYRISVEGYECNGERYITANPHQELLTVEAGQRIEKDISVNVRLIEPVKMNLHGAPYWKPCKP